MSEALIWINGSIKPRAGAVVSVYDKGFTSGDGVFETLKVIDGQPFALTRHLNRLESSAKMLDLVLPQRGQLVDAISETIQANADRIGAFARLRVTVTGGEAAGGSIPGKGNESTVVLTADPQAPHPTSVRVLSAPWVHNEKGPLVGAKTTSYADNLAILAWARKQDADEAIVADSQGRVCEATTANVLIAVKGTLVTPTLATGCLGGVTRSLLIEWGLVEERDVGIAQLRSVEELLIASSTRDLIPVASLDGRELVAPGPIGAHAIDEFRRRASEHVDP